MRRTTLIVLLTLALSSSAMAQEQWINPYRDLDARYQSRSGQRITALAREIEDTAASIRRQAEQNNRRPDRNEARMLSALRELHEEASHFQDEVGDSRRDSRGSRGDLGELFRAYDLTAESLRHVSQRPYVDRGMEQIGYLLKELSQSPEYYPRDRYDSRLRDDRYDDRGRYDYRSP
ncbi:MAG TPA: hypothetical protein VMW27_09620 [Thermoanaerobaculia bacterium]|nr:hypothetical protein [Thermoanaerobaculia bacterium]